MLWRKGLRSYYDKDLDAYMHMKYAFYVLAQRKLNSRYIERESGFESVHQKPRRIKIVNGFKNCE